MSSKLKRKTPGKEPKSRQKYKCPVINCKALKIRGDDIPKHFLGKCNLVALDKANEHQSELRKKFKASDAIAVPDEFLKNLMISESEKSHTLYLFQNGFSSISMPNINSVGFKCQQYKKPVAAAFQGWVLKKPGKAIRLSDSIESGTVDNMQIETESTLVNETENVDNSDDSEDSEDSTSNNETRENNKIAQDDSSNLISNAGDENK